MKIQTESTQDWNLYNERLAKIERNNESIMVAAYQTTEERDEQERAKDLESLNRLQHRSFIYIKWLGSLKWTHLWMILKK
jgi:hypothetical protein